MKPLTKKVLEQLSKEEIKELERLQTKHTKLTAKMIKAQRAYTDAARAGKEDKALRKLADKGFKLEYETMQANKELTTYKNKLTKKYV